LEKSHAYPVKIEYFQTVRGAEAKFIWGIPAAETQHMLDAVRGADLAIVVAGLSARIEGEENESETLMDLKAEIARRLICRLPSKPCWNRFMPWANRLYWCL